MFKQLDLWKKSILAGILISFGGMFSIVASPYGPIVKGLCFSVGLFGVLACQAKLFTGSVLEVSVVWMDHNHSDIEGILCELRYLIKKWFVIWIGNLIGSLMIVGICYAIGFNSGDIAASKASLPLINVFFRALLCNILVCMCVYIFNRVNSNIPVSALTTVLLPVSCFVACGMEHSVANMFYMPLGLLYGSVDILQCTSNILIATVGNFVGGTLFSWLVNGKNKFHF